MASLPGVPSLDNSFGALLIGLIVSSALWGVGCAQCYWWYLMYPRDSVRLKMLVVFAWMFDTVHQAVISHLVYFYLATNYFKPPMLDYHVWSLQLQTLFEALTCICVQGFFVHRIWTLSNRNYFLAAIPMVFVLGNFAMGVTYTVRAFYIPSITVAIIDIRPESLSINGLAAAADIVIAGMMCVLLSHKRTGVRNGSDRVVVRLMIYSVHTGLITSVAAIATLILALALPRSTVYGAVYFVTGKLYLNTMMASLNARKKLAVMNRSTTSADAPYINVTKDEVTVRDDDADLVSEIEARDVAVDGADIGLGTGTGTSAMGEGMSARRAHITEVKESQAESPV